MIGHLWKEETCASAVLIVSGKVMQPSPMSGAAHSVQPQLASRLQLAVTASAPATYGALLSEEEKTRQQAWGEEGLVSPGPQRRLRSLGSREASLASSKGEGPPTSVWRLLRPLPGPDAPRGPPSPTPTCSQMSGFCPHPCRLTFLPPHHHLISGPQPVSPDQLQYLPNQLTCLQAGDPINHLPAPNLLLKVKTLTVSLPYLKNLW